MTELTFWIPIMSNDDSEVVLKAARGVLKTFYNYDDYELLIINFAEDVMEGISELEQEYSQNVLLVNCDVQEYEKAFEIMLGYANGICFLEIQSNMELKGGMFDALQYDPSACDEDGVNYIKNKYLYILEGEKDSNFSYKKEFEKICLKDYRETAGSIDNHYFYQDIYVASKVKKMGAKHIYDIGSRVDGYISHLLSMGIEVSIIDIRPLDYKVEGLSFIQGDAMKLEGITDSSLELLSSLHALEHFGLGRYGDPVDYYGWKKALNQFKRVMKMSGILLLSVPVGKTERVCFNAHRIFRPMTIVNELMPDMQLLEFTAINGSRKLELDFRNSGSFDRVRNTMEEVSDKMLGEYDCGIFQFMRC